MRPRVAFVVPGGLDAETGGNVYDRAVCDALARRGWDVVVVEAAEGVDTDVIVLDSLAFRQGRPATLRPLVALVHQLPSEAAGRAPSPAELEVLHAATSVVTASGWLAEHVRGLGAGHVVAVPPGRDRAWATEGARADAATVLCVGNAYPGKGLPEVVEAFSRATPAGITLRIAGDPSFDAHEASRLRAAIERSSAPVELAGVLTPQEMSLVYGEALLFVTASRYEGWPVAVAEAMASGLAVVGFDVPGVAELVRDRVDGVLVPSGDIQALSASIASLCSDARMRARFSAAARARALGWPTWKETGERFADVVEAVAGQRSGAPYAP